MKASPSRLGDQGVGGTVGMDFRTTHWSMVLATQEGDSALVGKAMSALCQAYWYPLYAYIRRRGYDPHQSQDLTQDFLCGLIQGVSLQTVGPNKGRFRAFLLACVKNFLGHERQRNSAQKRGGEYDFISLDLALAENRYGVEPVDQMSPDRLFDRRWALTLLDRALAQMREEYAGAGKTGLFDALQEHMTGSKNATHAYAVLAVEHQMTEGALRQAVHRMRCRFGVLLRLAVAQTVACPEEIESELSQLMLALGT